jgi:hypothetical protein
MFFSALCLSFHEAAQVFFLRQAIDPRRIKLRQAFGVYQQTQRNSISAKNLRHANIVLWRKSCPR